MRRHSTTPEKPYCHISYKLQDERCSNGWLDKGKTSLRSCKKKCTNRENFDVCAMAASVLPTTNAYNDYHKYHSVSGGSALSQSMKYAEAWLYGSLNIKPSIRSTFLSFDCDHGVESTTEDPPVVALSGSTIDYYCSCQKNDSKKQSTCPMCIVTMRNFNSMKTFGTVRNGVCGNNGVRSCQNVKYRAKPTDTSYRDPYDVVRQSRLSGVKNTSMVRAKSHSPSKRKPVKPLTLINRLPSPNTVEAETPCITSVVDDTVSSRKSILECNINPYDLVRKVPNDGDDGSSLLISDDDLVEERNMKTHKKQKATLKQRIKSKLRDSGGSKSLRIIPLASSIINSDMSKMDHKTAGDTIEGVSIAGQKIIIFTPPSKETKECSEDWISDPNVDDEPEPSNCVVNSLESEETPKRPPRRKSLRTIPPISSHGIVSNPVYQNYNSLCNQLSGSNVGPASTSVLNIITTSSTRTTTPTSSSSAHYGDIKSILKKPLSSSSNSPIVPSVGVATSYESDGLMTTNTMKTLKLAANAASVCNTNNGEVFGNSCDSNNNFYLMTFRGKQQANKKVKKQVQFKGMQEQTIEDESGSAELLSSPKRANVHINAIKRTGYEAENGINVPTTTNAVVSATTTTPEIRRRHSIDQPLVVYEQKADVERHSCADDGHHRRHLEVRSLQLPSPVIINECLPEHEGGSPSLNSSALSIATSSLDSVRETSDFVKWQDVISEPGSRLQRTLSECISQRSLLAHVHCEAFNDTMRLRVRCNTQIEPKRLFHPHRNHLYNLSNDKSNSNTRRMCLRPSIPPPLPPAVATITASNTNIKDRSVIDTSKPQLPPRQYFPFGKNENSVPGNTISSFKEGMGDILSPTSTTIAISKHEGNCSSTSEIRIPSLTRTFLQNRTCVNSPISTNNNNNKNINGYTTTESVIKINVIPEPLYHQQQSGPKNRTVITITPEKKPSSVSADVKVDSGSVETNYNDNGKTSIAINDDKRSPTAVYENNSCNTITINVGFSDHSFKEDSGSSFSSSNCYKSSVQISSPSSTVYVTSPNVSSDDLHKHNKTENNTAQRCDIVNCSSLSGIQLNSLLVSEYNSARVCICKQQTKEIECECESTSEITGTISSISTDSCDESQKLRTTARENDFSLHYMSCQINERLTEDDVGLTKNQTENVYDLTEPIYEEISETPPPLPLEPPPDKIDDIGIVIPPRSIFEGASKYDILKYLAGAKERCRIPEEPTPEFVVIEESSESDPSDLIVSSDLSRVGSSDLSSRLSHLSNVSDSSDELVTFLMSSTANSVCSLEKAYRNCADIERNDSGVGSETSKCSRSKWQHLQTSSLQEDQQHTCEDCEQPVESQASDCSLTYAPLVCRKCTKKRIERREIIAEIVETEEKYGRDLRIILDEFYKPMLVAGLLSPEQLSSIFLNVGELLEHNTVLAEKLRDGYEIAIEQGDEDLLTFNVGKIFLDSTPMLHAFESYCTRQGNAALLLANLEKEKELLKIFLRVSQMENAVLRRMNLNSFLMVPVQRVTKYPLLLARLYKVTPEHHSVQRELLKEAQHNIELHLEHINSVTKDIGSMKIWRRISMMNGRRVSGDADDIVNIKLQKIAVEVLEWGHDEVRFAMEGRLLYAQPTDYNWKRSGRTIKVVPINALLVTLGKPTENYNPECEDLLMFPQKNGIREASLLLMKEKGGKYSLVRDPLFLDHCIIYCDNDCEEYFEVQEIPTKDTYIFKAEDGERTRQWYKQLQYHSQGLGCWRKRRNALANIMINGMQVRT